jgi:hypothetical protein
VEGFPENSPPWSAFRAAAAGVGQIIVHNSTVIEWNFLAQTGNTTAAKMVDQVFLQARTRIELQEAAVDLSKSSAGEDEAVQLA